MIELVDLYSCTYSDETILAALYELLAEREPHVNISHKAMPSWEQHVAFVGLGGTSRPYKSWWLIIDRAEDGCTSAILGACYLSKNNEIGIQIFTRHQQQGYGNVALDVLIGMHPGHRLLANVAPTNDASENLFKKFGFVHIQNTFELNVQSTR